MATFTEAEKPRAKDVVELTVDDLTVFDTVTDEFGDNLARFTTDVKLQGDEFTTTAGRDYLDDALRQGQEAGQQLQGFMAEMSTAFHNGDSVVISSVAQTKTIKDTRYRFTMPSTGESRILGVSEAAIVMNAFLPVSFTTRPQLQIRVLEANKPIRQQVIGSLDQGRKVELRFNPPGLQRLRGLKPGR